ncbi:MAG: haloalkane dehalogenase [Deltaproteobacteria bacterium]|nr:haloalkane dehalogenase [Deltaproteobacteria bacterium]
MKVLRTPEARFENLPGFNFQAHYREVLSQDQTPLRMHYLDEGDTDGQPVLFMHGEPSWCFLYRKMIPILAEAGFRVLAPDLIGFGKSDKPAKQSDYSYQAHVDWITQWLKALDLKNIALVCQDWGGLIGLRVAAENEALFSSIIAANTALPTGDQKMPEAFFQWQKLSQEIPEFMVGNIVNMGCVSDLSQEIIQAYDAPFPDESYKAGARVFPLLVPTKPDDPASEANREAWKILQNWQKPFLTAFSDKDFITRGGEKVFQKLIPGAQDQPHTIIENAGHFLQEDQGEKLAEVILKFLKSI